MTGDASSEKSLTSIFSQGLLAFLFAQTFKAALDHGLAMLTEHQDWAGLWDHLPKNPSQHFSDLVQMTAFIATLSRFYAGAHRFNSDDGRDTRLGSTFRDVAWMMVLSGAFYFAALLVASNGLFLMVITLIHVIDLLWFVSSGGSKGHAPHVKVVIEHYQRFDMITILLAALAGMAFQVIKFDPSYFQWISSAILFVMFIADIREFWDWYFDPAKWRTAHAGRA